MVRPMRSGERASGRVGKAIDQSGWVMLALLFLLAALGTGMAALGTVWSTAVQREKEAELLFIGREFIMALERYHRAGPGPEKSYPPSLEALVLDPRFPMPVRHLRRIYVDPMTGAPDWGLVRDAQGGIVGVHSLSERAPLKVHGFPAGMEGFAAAMSYRDWVFRAQAEPIPPTTTVEPGHLTERPGASSSGAAPGAEKPSRR